VQNCSTRTTPAAQPALARSDQYLIEAMKPYAWAWRLLQTIPGIDEIAAAMILIEIGDKMHTVRPRTPVETESRLHKLLDDAGIKLGGVVSDIDGVCARKMVEGLIAGSTPEQLSALGRGKLKSTGEVLEAVATTSPQASARAARPATPSCAIFCAKPQTPRDEPKPCSVPSTTVW
jgi:hypothetical protein